MRIATLPSKSDFERVLLPTAKLAVVTLGLTQRRGEKMTTKALIM